MSKKQILIPKQELANYLSKDRMLSFIMLNSSVVLAMPVSIKVDILKVKNTRGRKMDLPLSEVREIWAEEKMPLRPV
ncbi:MAG: hypothetical protein ABJN36_13480 [Cyclobacteriaceae bacterium]